MVGGLHSWATGRMRRNDYRGSGYYDAPTFCRQLLAQQRGFAGVLLTCSGRDLLLEALLLAGVGSDYSGCRGARRHRSNRRGRGRRKRVMDLGSAGIVAQWCERPQAREGEQRAGYDQREAGQRPDAAQLLAERVRGHC